MTIKTRGDKKFVELDYYDLEVTLQKPRPGYPRYHPDEYEDVETTKDFTLLVPLYDIETFLYEECSDEGSLKDVPEDELEEYISKHVEELTDEFSQKILDRYEDEARTEIEENYDFDEDDERDVFMTWDSAQERKKVHYPISYKGLEITVWGEMTYPASMDGPAEYQEYEIEVDYDYYPYEDEAKAFFIEHKDEIEDLKGLEGIGLEGFIDEFLEDLIEANEDLMKPYFKEKAREAAEDEFPDSDMEKKWQEERDREYVEAKLGQEDY